MVIEKNRDAIESMRPDKGNGMDSTTKMNSGANMIGSRYEDVVSEACGAARHPMVGSACCQKKAINGFTLIELLIAVAIVGILAAIAVPSYSIFITNANRTDAMSFLSEVAGEQQRYFSENNEYADEMSDLEYGNAATFPSPEGHYTISISNSSATNLDYTLSATPVAGGRQDGDDECDVFTISSTGVKANTGGSNSNCW